MSTTPLPEISRINHQSMLVSKFFNLSFSSFRTVGDTMAGIVNKCIAAPKTKTKDLAAQVTLMYIEIEKQEQVQEELMKGFEHKNPKTVAACVSVMTQAVRYVYAANYSFNPATVKVILQQKDLLLKFQTLYKRR